MSILQNPKIQYMKAQFVPKNKYMKVLYIGLWICDPVFMLLVMGIKLAWSRKH